MKPNPLHRLPAPLEAAVQRLKLAARDATERTIESLGLAALASTNVFHRDGLLGAQFELNRKSAVFVLTFNDAFDQRMLRELGPRAAGERDTVSGTASGTVLGAVPAAGVGLTDWASLSLVEDKEVEAQISAERFGMEIAHACEWELRELQGYVAALLGEAGGERDRNPLRPDLVGHAMIRGIEALSDRADVRKVLAAELSRSLGGLLPSTYADIVTDLRSSGVQPVGMAVRQRAMPGAGAGGAGSAGGGDEASGPSDFDGLGRRGGRHADGASQGGAFDGRASTRRSAHGAFGPTTRAGTGSRSQGGAPQMGQVDPALMSLIRRLAYSDGGGGGAALGDGGVAYADAADTADAALPPNVIRAHREELRQASTGALDHMVIDVIGFLFDQILADPKVPPQDRKSVV